MKAVQELVAYFDRKQQLTLRDLEFTKVPF